MCIRDSFWRDLAEMLGAKRVHSVHASIFYLGANAMLTALQFIWARPVVRGIFTVVAGKKKAKDG